MSSAYLLLLSPFVLMLCLVAFWYYRYFGYRRQLKCLREVKGYPLLGAALELLPVEDVYGIFVRFHKKYGSTVWAMFGFDAYVITADPKLLKVILSSSAQLQKSTLYDLSSLFLGKGLLTSSGEKWKTRRKMISPAFHLKVLEKHCSSFNANSNILVKQLAKETSKASTEISSYIYMCYMDIICETALGTKMRAQENGSNKYMLCIEEMLKFVTEQVVRPFETFTHLYYFTNAYASAKKCFDYCDSYTSRIIQQRRAALATNNQAVREANNGRQKMTFIDLLLTYTDQDGKPLSNEDIREEVNTFMGAGIETMATSTCFVLHLLANNPDVQDKAFLEQKSMFKDDRRRTPTFKELQEMKYLDMVIKESLRLYPGAPLIGRKLTEDVEFEGNVLSKGMEVFLAIFLTHRFSSEPFNGYDTEVFEPERFLTDPEDTFRYLPFSAGPRSCIGQRYAMLGMKSVMSNVLRNYELVSVGHELDLKMDVVLKSKTGFVLAFRERHW